MAAAVRDQDAIFTKPVPTKSEIIPPIKQVAMYSTNFKLIAAFAISIMPKP